MKNRKWLWALLAVVLVLGGASFLYGRLSAKGAQWIEENTTDAKSVKARELVPAPDFTVLDEDGNEVRLSDYRGKPVVMNFWASWCGYCKKEMPDFEEVYQEMGDEVQFLMVNSTDGRRETVEAASAYIQEGGYTFPVFYDVNQEAVSLYGAYSIPATVFIDAEGDLVGSVSGALSKNVLKRGIELILPADFEK